MSRGRKTTRTPQYQVLQLETLLQRRRATVTEIAETAGISAPTLSQLKNGVNGGNIMTLSAIARALDVPLYMLFVGAPIPDDLGPLPPRQRAA